MVLPRVTEKVFARLLIGVAALLGSLVSSAAPVFAGSEMVVTVGYGGYVQAGLAYPVAVEVSTDELFSGELRFSTDGGVGAVTRDVQFAGGTVNDVTTVLDQSPFNTGSLQVELVADDGQVVATKTVRLRDAPGSDLVGVFPGAVGGGLPEKSSVSADAGEALLFGLDADVLAAGYGALDPLDQVVMTAEDLRGLDAGDLDLLLAWVNTGGRLLVDEPTGTEIPGVPAEWQPIGSAPHGAGTGEILFVDGAARAGDWGEILEPAASRSRVQDQEFGEIAGFFGGEPLSWSLGRDAGFSLPGTPTMIAVLLGYVVLVGPGLWFVLKVLRRPGLAWVLVPVSAVVVTGIIWVAGASYRSGIEVAHGTIVQVAPAGTVVTSYELLSSRTGAGKSITIPSDWLPAGAAQEGIPRSIEVAYDGDSQYVSTTVDAGGFVVLGAMGPASDFDGALEVTASSAESGNVRGTITNHLDVDLFDVGVFADAAGTNIGDVAAGQSVEFELSSAPVIPNTGEPVEFKVWPGALPPEWTGDFGTAFDPGEVNMSLWSESGARSSVNARGVGDLVVAGWSDQLASPLDESVTLGRTLVMARSNISPSGDGLTDVAVQRDLVRGSNELGSNFRMNDSWGGGAMVRFVLPERTRVDDLVLELPANQRRVELFDDGEWKQIDVDEYRKGVFALPATAVDDGRVYVKVLVSFERNATWRDLSVRTATDDEEVERMRFVTAEAAG